MKQLNKVVGLFILGFLGLLLVLLYDKQEIVIESQESKTTSGGSVFNKIKWFQFKDKDIWMMNQSHHGHHGHHGSNGSDTFNSSWDRLAIVVDKSVSPKTARFYQFEPGPLEWKENLPQKSYKVSCFMCHSNGPRVIRPNFDSTFNLTSMKDRLKIMVWNLRIKSYRRMTLNKKHDEIDSGLKVPVRFRGSFENESLKVATCIKCHKESGFFARGPLLRQNISTIKFMVEAGHMPPFGFQLSSAEKLELEKFLMGF